MMDREQLESANVAPDASAGGGVKHVTRPLAGPGAMPEAGQGGRSRSRQLPSAPPGRLGRLLASRYRLDRLLGMGAMGEVYHAMDTHQGLECAVKLVFPGAARSLQAQRRFVNESQLVAQLFHPNIVEVRDFSEDADGTRFLVMELLVGQDLQELLSEKGKLPVEQVIEIVRGIGAGLQYAHDLGIVHRDVKPNNVFIKRSTGTLGDQVKVLDFGLAKLLGDCGTLKPEHLTQGIIVGTPAYLSPEATALIGGHIDERSDQWALAVLTYQMLAGQLPFSHPNPYYMCQMICADEPAPLSRLVPGLPPHIYRVIAKAMSKRQEDRFARVADFVRSLENLPSLALQSARPVGRASREQPVVAASPPPPPPPEPGLERTVRYSDEALRDLCKLSAAPAAEGAAKPREAGPTAQYKALPIELLQRLQKPEELQLTEGPAPSGVALIVADPAQPLAPLGRPSRHAQLVSAASLLLCCLLAMFLGLHIAKRGVSPWSLVGKAQGMKE